MRKRAGLAAMLKRGAADTGGAAAVELAFVAPLFVALLAAVADLGGMALMRANLSDAATAATQYALNKRDNASSSQGAQLASDLAALVANARGQNWANATAVVNNGPANAVANGAASASGAPANADKYWCPSRSGATVSWGLALPTSGLPCPGGGFSGKFIQITASRTYSPLILPSVISNGLVTITAMVQVQ